MTYCSEMYSKYIAQVLKYLLSNVQRGELSSFEHNLHIYTSTNQVISPVYNPILLDINSYFQEQEEKQQGQEQGKEQTGNENDQEKEQQKKVKEQVEKEQEQEVYYTGSGEESWGSVLVAAVSGRS